MSRFRQHVSKLSRPSAPLQRLLRRIRVCAAALLTVPLVGVSLPLQAATIPVIVTTPASHDVTMVPPPLVPITTHIDVNGDLTFSHSAAVFRPARGEVKVGYSDGNGLQTIVSLSEDPDSGQFRFVETLSWVEEDARRGFTETQSVIELQVTPSDLTPRHGFGYITNSHPTPGVAAAPLIVVAGAGRSFSESTVTRFRGTDGTSLGSFQPCDAGDMSPIRMAIGDVTRDGIPDIVVAGCKSPLVLESEVRVFSPGPSGGVELTRRGNLQNQVNGFGMALGDVDGDGHNDIVTASFAASDSDDVLVEVLNTISGVSTARSITQGAKGAQRRSGETSLGDFFLVRVNDDERADLVLGAHIGEGFVRAFDLGLDPMSPLGATPTMLAEFYPYGPDFTGGVQVAGGTVVPEPASVVLLGLGLAGVVAIRVMHNPRHRGPDRDLRP